MSTKTLELHCNYSLSITPLKQVKSVQSKDLTSKNCKYKLYTGTVTGVSGTHTLSTHSPLRGLKWVWVKQVKVGNVWTEVASTCERAARRARGRGHFRGGRAPARAVTRSAAAARPSARPCLPWAAPPPGPSRTASTDPASLLNPGRV